MSSHNITAISPSSLPLKMSMGRRNDRPDVETEYAEILRQYRAVESEKKVYTEKTQTQLKKLEAMVEKLQEDNIALRQEIKNLEQRKISIYQNTISPKVAELSEKISNYMAKVDAETNRLQQLDIETQNTQQRIKSQQDVLGGMGLTQIELQTNTYIKTLENRLQTALSKYSETIASTKKLRNEIEGKKREKQVFDNLSKKREREISERKKKMSKIVEESNYAYEARDDLQNKMFSIRERAAKETAEYEDQLAEANRIIEQEEARKGDLEQTIALLGNYDHRGSSDMLKATKNRNPNNNNNDPNAAAAPMTDEEMQVNEMEEQIQKYEDFFNRLSQLTDRDVPEEIVHKIVGDEFQNFSRFNFINETNKEAEKLEEEIKLLKVEVERCKKSEDQGGDKIRKKLLEGLQQQLEDTERKTEKFEAKAAACLKVFGVKDMLHEILDTLGDTRVRDLSISELNETNIWRFLAALSMGLRPYLRGYINTLSREHNNTSDNYDDITTGNMNGNTANNSNINNNSNNNGVSFNKTNALLGLSDNVIEDLLAQSSLVQIDPPTTGFDSADAEDQAYPFSSEEMRMKLTGTWTGTRDTMSPSRRSKKHASSSSSSKKAQLKRSASTTSVS